MRWIQKQVEPLSLAQFLAANGPIGVNLDYDKGFTRKAQLLQELCTEQFQLCGYTGTPLDTSRLSRLDGPMGIVFRSHVEHIKSQATCIREQRGRHETPGTVAGEDVDYHNVIAALEVRGTDAERFGAVTRESDIVPMPPTQPACETEYLYLETGYVVARSTAADLSITDLRLNHDTLALWRLGAMDTFLPLREQTPSSELQSIIQVMTEPSNGILPEFAFVIAQLARDYLDMKHLSA
jgi:hypothetical protein